MLSKVFQYRSCTGTEPGRRSGSPCLDFHINRCGAPCVDKVTREEYLEAIDGVVAFLSGRYAEIEREIERRMNDAAAAQEYETAALERNRLRAVRSLLQRQRVANESVGTLDAIAVAVDGADKLARFFAAGKTASRRIDMLRRSEKVELENVNHPGQAKLVPADMYEGMKQVFLKAGYVLHSPSHNL